MARLDPRDQVAPHVRRHVQATALRPAPLALRPRRRLVEYCRAS